MKKKKKKNLGRDGKLCAREWKVVENDMRRRYCNVSGEEIMLKSILFPLSLSLSLYGRMMV